MSDVIALRGLAVEACHGVLPQEKVTPQPFVLDIDLDLDLSWAGAADDLADTVSYADIAHRAATVVSGPPVDLIETLADRVASACLGCSELIEAVAVTVHKPRAPIGLPFADVAVTRRRVRAARAVIGLGANLAHRSQRLADAVRRIAALDGVTAATLSPLVETEPVGGPPGQQAYLNAVLTVGTRLAPRTLLRHLQGIEAVHGRTRDVRWGPRTLDLDVLFYADPGEGGFRESADPALTLPHPRAHERAFVLLPWLLAAPGDPWPRAAWAALTGTAGERPSTREDAAGRGVRPGPDWPAHVAAAVLVTEW